VSVGVLQVLVVEGDAEELLGVSSFGVVVDAGVLDFVGDGLADELGDAVTVQKPSVPQVAIDRQHSFAQHVSVSGQAPPSQQISVSLS